MSEICWMNAVELLEAYQQKQLSPVEVVETLFKRIDAVNPPLRCPVGSTGPACRWASRSWAAGSMKNGAAGFGGV